MTSYDILEQRMGSVGNHLAELARTWDTNRIPASLFDAQSWLVTGSGGSVGPGLMLVDALHATGRRARYMPLSYFLETPRSRDEVLVVFSQGLSPNAHIALSRSETFRHTVLFTSIGPDTVTLPPACHVVHLPPKDEESLLVRVIGPTVATLAALLFVDTISGRGHRPESGRTYSGAALREARMAAPPIVTAEGRIALVTFGVNPRRYYGLSHKLLETIGEQVPVWDVLGIAHGPFQHFCDAPVTLIALTRGEPHHEDLRARLAALLDQRTGQQVLPFPAAQPLDWFAHDAMIDRFILSVLRSSPRDLVNWPGKGADRSLYGIGR